MGKSPAVFADRDGTLIRDVGYLSSADQIEVLPGVIEAARLLQENGFKVVVVTNQSAVARGFLSEEALGLIHLEIRRRLEKHGVSLDGIYYCPHHPDAGEGRYRMRCECRKPSPGMIERASLALGLDIHHSYVVGDQLSDMELARRIGAKAILIDSSVGGSGREGAVALSDTGDWTIPVVGSFWAAAQRIVAEPSQGWRG